MENWKCQDRRQEAGGGNRAGGQGCIAGVMSHHLHGTASHRIASHHITPANSPHRHVLVRPAVAAPRPSA